MRKIGKWIVIEANRSKEAWDNYVESMKKLFHKHICPKHGRYDCPWSICSIQLKVKPPTFHCRDCIMEARGQSKKAVQELRKVKTKQIKNKRAYRKKLNQRETNKTARGIK